MKCWMWKCWHDIDRVWFISMCSYVLRRIRCVTPRNLHPMVPWYHVIEVSRLFSTVDFERRVYFVLHSNFLVQVWTGAVRFRKLKFVSARIIMYGPIQPKESWLYIRKPISRQPTFLSSGVLQLFTSSFVCLLVYLFTLQANKCLHEDTSQEWISRHFPLHLRIPGRGFPGFLWSISKAKTGHVFLRLELVTC